MILKRIFLRKLVADVMDRVDQYEDFDPRTDYALALLPAELTNVEAAAVTYQSVEDVDLDLTRES